MQNHVETVLPLSALCLSPKNVRKIKTSPESIATMAASLRASGQLQNIVVYEMEPGRYGVAAGERRFLGFKQLEEAGDVAPDHEVRVIQISEEEATSASTIENIEREQMHPADQFDAFAKMTAEGKSIEAIADTFGVTPLVVERRLRLAQAAPELLEKFRAGEINTDQMIALCTTSDHERQLSTWNNAQHWNRTPADLRRAILSEEIDLAHDKRLPFIGGVEVFEAAGGNVRRDLFAPAGAPGLTKDGNLLDRLVCEKLDAIAAPIQNEGWAWVEVRADMSEVSLHNYGRLRVEPVELPEELKTALAAAEKELTETQDAIHELEYNSEVSDEEAEPKLEALYERSGELEDKISGIKGYAEENGTYPTEGKAYAGVIVALRGGKVEVARGLVRPEDRKDAKKTAAVVTGGRETASAGRKSNAISDALRRNLLGQRNIAVQIEVAKNVRVAKVLAIAKMVKDAEVGFSDVPCDLSLREGYGTRTHHPVDGEHANGLQSTFAKIVAGSLGKHGGAKDLWAALYGLSDAELDRLLAVGIARSVSVIEEHKGLTADLLDALEFDMADHFTANAESYFGRINKPLIVEALKDAGKGDDGEQLVAMKRPELAELAAKRVEGLRWVPELIRGPARKPKASAKPAAAKKAATKAPAKKAAPKKATTKAPAKKAGKAKA